LFEPELGSAAEAFWSPDYIQHSAHIPQGRNGLFDLIKSLPRTLKYENDVVMAEDELIMLHGRFSGTGLPANWIAADIVRLDQGQNFAGHVKYIAPQGVRERDREFVQLASRKLTAWRTKSP
jgi:predicted SnoaL-like aldol condensation-catalyzing enzyme